MESLSSQRSTEPLQSVSYCLQAIHTLLESPWPRSKLSADPILTVELLNVMHRVLLTRETLCTHQQVVLATKQSIKAMHEKLNKQRQQHGTSFCLFVLLLMFFFVLFCFVCLFVFFFFCVLFWIWGVTSN